jgi:hypothetical protein
MTGDIEQELRASLRREVDRVEVAPAPDLEPAPAPARWRQRLRRLWRPAGSRAATIAIAAVAAVAVAVTAFAVPALLRGNGDTTLPPTQTYNPSLTPGQWPVRGPLADDEKLLAKAQSWFAANVSNTVKLKPRDFHIVYAGDVGEYRIIVATFVRTYDGPDRERSREFVSLSAPKGSSDLKTGAEEFGGPQLAQATDVRSYRAMAVVDGISRQSHTVLVIAPPGTTRLDYSPTADLLVNGAATRTWSSVRDSRVEDGIFRFDAPPDGARPRIRAVADGRVVGDSRLNGSSGVDDNELARLQGLISAGSGGKPVGRLATELNEFEYTIGRVIERVDVVRTFGPDNDYWIQAVVHTVDGGAIEVFFSDQPDKRDRRGGGYGLDGQPAPLVARLVSAAEAGKGVATWLNLEQCRVLGWDPTGRTAAVELLADGRPLGGRKPSAAQPISADFCANRGEWDDPKLEVRLYDQAGKRVWSGEPVYNPSGGFINEHANLDSPTTFGARVN